MVVAECPIHTRQLVDRNFNISGSWVRCNSKPSGRPGQSRLLHRAEVSEGSSSEDGDGLAFSSRAGLHLHSDMFGKRKTSIPADRLARVVSQSPRAGTLREIKGTALNRSVRKNTWAPCALCWPPSSKESGICLDVSETGARLRFTRRVHAPRRCRFVCAKYNIATDCEIVRQDGYDLAVHFIEPFRGAGV
jgi:hypothetical protein